MLHAARERTADMYVYRLPVRLANWKDKSYIPKFNTPITLSVQYQERRKQRCAICKTKLELQDLTLSEYYFSESGYCSNNYIHYDCF